MSLIVSEVYDALIEAGASEAKAKAAAGAIPLAEHLATKDDIAGVKIDIAGVKTDIAEVRTELAEVKAELKADMSGLEARLTHRLWLMSAVIVGLNVALIKLLD